MALTPATNQQVPDHAILDYYNKQTYLGNQYVYAIGSQAIASTSEIPLILLSNPTVASASFPSKYKGLFVNLTKLICLTASQSAIFRLYSNPTVTGNGTAKIPLNLRPASPNVSQAALFLNPTVSANGTILSVLASTPSVPDSSSLMCILDAGQSLLITVQTSANPTSIASELAWQEI